MPSEEEVQELIDAIKTLSDDTDELYVQTFEELFERLIEQALLFLSPEQWHDIYRYWGIFPNQHKEYSYGRRRHERTSATGRAGKASASRT